MNFLLKKKGWRFLTLKIDVKGVVHLYFWRIFQIPIQILPESAPQLDVNFFSSIFGVQTPFFLRKPFWQTHEIDSEEQTSFSPHLMTSQVGSQEPGFPVQPGAHSQSFLISLQISFSPHWIISQVALHFPSLESYYL